MQLFSALGSTHHSEQDHAQHVVLPASCCVACSMHSSNFVMTAAAQNLLCLQLAAGIGVILDDPFQIWLKGSCVPAALGKYAGIVLPCWVLRSINAACFSVYEHQQLFPSSIERLIVCYASNKLTALPLHYHLCWL